jgi:ATP-binding cassette subfamily F protein 2
MESIDALAEAINEWSGGIVLVSHDFRLISQVAEQILLCEGGKISPWEGSIEAYKERLRKTVKL